MSGNDQEVLYHCFDFAKMVQVRLFILFRHELESPATGRLYLLFAQWNNLNV